VNFPDLLFFHFYFCHQPNDRGSGLRFS
jgi:hypothetical protein